MNELSWWVESVTLHLEKHFCPSKHHHRTMFQVHHAQLHPSKRRRGRCEYAMRGSERNEGRKRLARKEVIERREVSMGQSCAAGWEEKQKRKKVEPLGKIENGRNERGGDAAMGEVKMAQDQSRQVPNREKNSSAAAQNHLELIFHLFFPDYRASLA